MPRRRIYTDYAEKQRAYRRRKRKQQPVYFRQKSDEGGTPPELFEQLDREFSFTLDVAAVPDNTKCDKFYPPGEDSQIQEWKGCVG